MPSRPKLLEQLPISTPESSMPTYDYDIIEVSIHRLEQARNLLALAVLAHALFGWSP